MSTENLVFLIRGGALFLGATLYLLTGESFGQTTYKRGIIAAAPWDEFRVLAEEIAAETGYPLLQSPIQALELNPEFLIWVISPAVASDDQFVAYGQASEKRPSQISLGIITGGTLENARALWNRGKENKRNRMAAINGQSGGNFKLEGRVLSWPAGQLATCALTLESMRKVLQESDYVTFSGHGTPVSLVLDPSSKMRAEDVPPLLSLVVGTSSCNTLRFWSDRSIALAFIDQGAAAYAGFVYSPNSGYLLGAFEDMPFHHTWPEFPIGHAIQVLNQGCRLGFAAFPFYHMLGDPRMALSDRPCYEVVSDSETNGLRRILGRGAPAGVIPVRVRNGAAYPFIRIPGITAISTNDWFYNSRLQMADMGEDKLLLFIHSGGDFTIELHRSVPTGWVAQDTLLDALDHSLIYNSQGRINIILQLLVGGMVMAWAGWRCRKAKHASWLTAVLAGASFMVLVGLYGWLRQDEITIISKPVTANWLAFSGIFLVMTGGSLAYLEARKWQGRLLGLLLACSFPLLSTVGIALLLFIMESRMSKRLGSAIWNYQLALPNLVVLILLFTLCLICFEGIRRWPRIFARRSQSRRWLL